MLDVKLILSVPQGALTATSLGTEDYALHRSPGSGKHFKGRKVFAELKIKDLKPDFEFMNEGGWRDTAGDTEKALAAASAGKRTKTALSNNAFSCIPISAYHKVNLVKTGGKVLELEAGGVIQKFISHACSEDVTPGDVALRAAGEDSGERHPRIYLVICPIELLLVSNLSPVEYAWYATHRPGKVFRQMIFTELQMEQPQLTAKSRYRDAREELVANPHKKTKTIISENCMNDIPFNAWLGYKQRTESGLFVANREQISIYQFPKEIPAAWDVAH